MGWEEGETFSGELRGCKANGSREKGDDLSQHKSNQSLLLLDLIKTGQHHYCFFLFLQTNLSCSYSGENVMVNVRYKDNTMDQIQRGGWKRVSSGESLTCLMILNKIVGTSYFTLTNQNTLCQKENDRKRPIFHMCIMWSWIYFIKIEYYIIYCRKIHTKLISLAT